MTEEKSETGEGVVMSADELIRDFALGLMRVCDENLEMNKRRDPNYPDGDEIAYDVLYQSCVELFNPLSTKENSMEAIDRWVGHERWCVRALAQGVKHLLEHGSFNLGPDIGVEQVSIEEVDEDFDCFINFADLVT